jgi:CMP-N,N'-diacetyllegionaminic acid synthase
MCSRCELQLRERVPPRARPRLRTLFLITARGGSKGVPRKNLRELGGISLVGFKAISARKSKHCTRLIVSTDSPEIKENARRYGAEAPFTRPSELATDTAKTVDVIAHAMEWIETNTGERYDALMLLEPASPFARALDYDAAVEMMVARDADVVVGVRPVEVNSVFVGPLDEQGRIASIIDKMQQRTMARRQDLPQEYTMNAALYLMKWGYFKEHRNIYYDGRTTYGYVMPPEYSVEIDTMMDLKRAEFLVEKGHVDLSYWKE